MDNAEVAIGEKRVAQQLGAELQSKTETEKRAHLDQSLADVRVMADTIAKGEIDPNRLWNSKSTGQKIAAGIFMLLGSGGDAINKSPGATVKAFEGAIDRDIAAQNTSLESKKHAAGLYEHLFQMGLQKFGSKEAGDALRKQAMLEAVDMQLSQQEAAATSDKARLAVRETRTMTQQKIAEYRGQLEAAAMGSKSTSYQTVGDKYVGGKGPDEVGAAKLFGEAGEAAAKAGGSTADAFRLNGQEVEFRPGLAPTEKSVARKTASDLQEAKNRLRRVNEQQTGEWRNWIASPSGAAVIRDYLTAKSQADHEGVTRNDDVEFGMKNLLGMNSEGAREWLRKGLEGTERNLFDNYGTRILPTRGQGAGPNLDAQLARTVERNLGGEGAPPAARGAPAHTGPKMSKEQAQTMHVAAAYGVSPEVAQYLQAPTPTKKSGKK